VSIDRWARLIDHCPGCSQGRRVMGLWNSSSMYHHWFPFSYSSVTFIYISAFHLLTRIHGTSSLKFNTTFIRNSSIKPNLSSFLKVADSWYTSFTTSIKQQIYIIISHSIIRIRCSIGFSMLSSLGPSARRWKIIIYPSICLTWWTWHLNHRWWRIEKEGYWRSQEAQAQPSGQGRF
jgi:hypothetical protein